jgi:4-amino-4-deoxy-L-arabinose transferase-like glycosyltransferase
VVIVLLAPARQRTSTDRFVVWVVLAMLLVRLVFMFEPLHADEAGYLAVAQSWHLGGPNLYGHYWVDRPPGLILLFKLASLVGWAPMIRVIAIPFVVLFVVSAAWAAHLVAGRQAARWSAVAAAALMTTPLLSAQEADGELFAAPLVMLAVAMTIAAVRRTGGPSYRLAFLAGLAEGLAVMIKQNFGDAIIFAVTLVVVSLVQGRMRSREALGILVGGLAGGGVVAAAAVAYAALSRVGVAKMWFALYGFRGAALDVIEDHNLHAPLVRAALLAVFGILSGAIPILCLLARETWRSRFTGSPIAWAVAVTVALETVGVIAGGSYWPHYLLQLSPMLALGAGLWVGQVRWLRAAVVLVAVSALVGTAFFAATGADTSNAGARVGGWLQEVSRPTDTVTVLYGNADVQEASARISPYPYLWTLPMRTLDPHLARLRALLSGPRAPTWVVVWGDLDPWNIDPHDQTRLVIATHYRLVRHPCGHELWLRDGVARGLAGAPAC